MIGTKLAHYEITAHLGSGGMGDVYQATDLKLKRSVAIKLLPTEFSSDSERLSRFRREAQLLASLNHPNIAHIYGLEESGDKRCIVMELIEGETLQARLKRGPIPVDEALGIARQICEALEAAHEKGVIHRDLKPGNVMLTGDGKVKVLDFGLAKAMESDISDANLSNSPTMMSGGSMLGVILGTAAYMSPEQARGRKVDKRTDIFAFGCILYEMLTGKRAFNGEDVSEIIARVLTGDPDWTLLPTSVPPRIRELLWLCLEKNSKNRRQDVRDVLIDIEQALKEKGTSLPPEAAPKRPRFIPVLVVAIIVFTLLGMGIESRLKKTVELSSPTPIQFSVSAPTGGLLSPLPWISVSPDGHWFSFDTDVRTGSTTWIRSLDSIGARELPGVRDKDNVMFWSPDSKQVAYTAGGKLRATEVSTGATRVLADVPGSGTGLGGSWSQSGMILFACIEGIYKVAASGGIPSRVDLKDGQEGVLRYLPQFLPDGEHFLYTTGANSVGGLQAASIAIGSIKSPEAKTLRKTDSAVEYVAPGYVLFVKSGTLWAQSFDLARLSLNGEAQALAQPFDGSSFFASENVLVFNPGIAEDSDLVWVDKNGKGTGKLQKPPTGTYANPAIAPDGRHVAVNSLDPRTGKTDIWIVDSSRDVAERFTLGGGSNADPVWSPDGLKIAFASNRDNKYGLYIKNVGGAAVEQLVSELPAGAILTDWSPDGKSIVYSDLNAGRAWLLSLSDHKSTRLLPTVESSQYGARFSHDGKWIAYASAESGRYEIYIQDFPNLTRRHQISGSGGIHPRWGKDDSEIYFHNMRSPQGIDVAALRRSGDDLTPESPRLAFDRPVPVVLDSRNQYTITPDGQRFLIRQPTASTTIPTLTVIVNWLATLHK